MNAVSACPADADAATAAPRSVRVWDAPTRVFHWLMVLSFAGAYLSAESERWRMLHVTLGYTMAGLVAFRLVWGLVGTRHARFANFVRGPAAVLRYVRKLAGGQHEDHVGHNPLGALGIVALLALTLAVAGTGWAVFEQIGGDWLEAAHEIAANTMLAVVGVHIAGVALASWMTHTNLVRAMVTGRKLAPPSEAIASAWRSVAAVMVVAVMGFWWLQWQSAPTAGEAAAQTATATAVGDRHRGRAKD